MTTCVTYDDVNLIVRLYELRRDEKLRQARAWFGESFHAQNIEEINELCPPGSDENAYFRMVLSYWDMVSTFVTSGVLEPNVFFKSGRELLVVWIRLENLLPALREQYKDAAYLEDLEAVAKDYVAWWEKRAPGAYEPFRARIAARPA